MSGLLIVAIGGAVGVAVIMFWPGLLTRRTWASLRSQADPQPIGYTVGFYDRHGDFYLFPEGNDVFPTQAEAKDYLEGCAAGNPDTRYLAVALVPCGNS